MRPLELLPYFNAVDLFCGAGGGTEGLEQTGVIRVTHAINHDKNAIESHKLNHPEAYALEEDIIYYDMKDLPEITDIALAGVECTNHSDAKGGGTRCPDSRTQPYQVNRYTERLRPLYFVVENVPEIMAWGDLTQKKNRKGEIINVPATREKGKLYMKWVKDMCSLGYHYDYRIFDCADFGAPTNRIRYFGVFAQKGLPISFPNPTHKKEATPMFGEKEWIPAKDVLDLDDKGKSIFGRKKPYVRPTLRRVAYGIRKFFLTKEMRQFLTSYYGSGNNANSIDNPLRALVTKDRHALVSVLENKEFITQHIHNSLNAVSINKPMGTVLTKDLKQLVSVDLCNYIVRQYGTSNAASMDKPVGTLTTSNKTSIVHLSSEPTPNQEEKLDFFLQFFFIEGRRTKKEKRTRCPFELEYVNTAFLLNDLIEDIFMRFIKIKEQLKAQGFPEDYKLVGTQQEKTKYIGNAIPPPMTKAIGEHLFHTYNRHVRKMLGESA